MQVIVFKVNEEQFAVEASSVQSINDMMEITNVPKSAAYIKGLINLRGNIISLLDINLLLDIEKGSIEQENIIILNLKEESVGVTVDQVDEVLEIETDLIEKIETDKDKAYIKGIINFKDRIVTLIDIGKLIER
ncbi:chemotaxis protein CheW [Clostridium estertheticum]|uniref:Chemotaxis protein CheW n=2 Tax=Clostridium estertheticum TaxID=238834 RepID=A0A1J0GJT6_9CLOT|nr:chemotaxis protein CheW [Clostridium estertheticum]APC41184.1 chemotaxis protein CheW [Clostridium estertheticum subsp. estertheticum]MBU3074196.1 chemotaxis protein CheW [Clostridium estertheticum]MBU3164290.1 chemotaxis protein CheW [Clostridium estertheticum]MBU3170227.1 chemotaxis protein CheW [Clostridium estertheticum]MBZ9616993.1 chemotaxis protein CheW [Clostridium estertheticum subsp. laramiense]